MGTVAIFILFSEHLCSLIWWKFPHISCLYVVGSEPNAHTIWISEYPITLTALKVDVWSAAFSFPLKIFSSISTINSQLQTAACFLCSPMLFLPPQQCTGCSRPQLPTLQPCDSPLRNLEVYSSSLYTIFTCLKQLYSMLMTSQKRCREQSDTVHTAGM